MDNNIKIAYFLAFCKNSWFWLGIWVFYYLLFTDYAGIGLIETSLIISMTASEIPTGAVADLLGKKKTLFISFFLQALGGFMMAFATHVNQLIISVFIMGVGGSFYSGTFEALIYDSLKERRKEGSYDKFIARMNAISLAAPAVCGLIGGYLYVLQPRLPFISNALFYTLALVGCLLLKEPKIDTVKFTFTNFIRQTKVGLSELFKNSFITKQTLLLLTIGVIIVICDEMLNSFLGVEYKFTPQQQGIMWSVIYLITAAASHYSPLIKKYLNYRDATIYVGLLIAITLIISPLLGMLLGGISLALRSSLQAAYGNYSSVLVNEQTDSNKRATTLSTFNLFKNIPYVFTAYFLGSLADQFSAVNTAAILGFILIVLLVAQVLTSSKQTVFQQAG